MIVTPKTTEEYIIGAEKEMEFSIDTDNHIIFEILRDKMYSDKIGAVAREVSSNSRDANREAGKGDVPIVIEIVKPNKFASIGHQTVVFQDNGIGITPDRMSDVFIKYASSTKRGSNNETGGFGLGAKTPFAYSDTFTVITVCEWAKPIIEKRTMDVIVGTAEYNKLIETEDVEVVEHDPKTETLTIKREVEVIVGHEPKRKWKFTYNAIIDESNKGKMIQFDSEHSEEPTGTKIVVPIKTDQDRHRFEQKIFDATKFWVGGVDYKGFYKTIPSIEAIIDEKDFMVVKQVDKQGYGLLIDGINYPLDLDQIDIDDKGVGLNYTILMKFGTGELTISANRESVQYDENTIKLLKERYETIKTRFVELVNDYISKLGTYTEACKFAFYMTKAKIKQRQEIKDDYLRVLAEAYNPNKDSYYQDKTILSNERDGIKKIVFDGKPLKFEIVLKHHQWVYVKEPMYDNKTDYSPLTRVNISERLLDSPIYYGDTRKNKRRNKTIWENEKTFSLIIPKGSGTDQEKLDEINEVMQEFDLQFSMYSDVEMKKPDTTSTNTVNYTKNKDVVQLNYKNFKYGYEYNSHLVLVNRKTKKLEDKDPEKYFYHVVPYLKDARLYWEERDKVQFLQKHTDKTVMIINESAHRNWIQHTGIKSLEHEYKKVEKKFKAKWEKESRRQIISDTWDEVSDWSINDLLIIKDEITPILPKCVQEIFNTKVYDKDEPFIKQDVQFDEEGLKKKLKKIFNERYPMLMPFIRYKLYRWNRTKNLDKKKEIIKEYLSKM